MKMKMRMIVFALASLAVLVANAQEKPEDNGSYDSSLMSADSRLKAAEFLNKPAVLSVNTRKSRAIDSKLAVESESPSRRDSLPLIRGPRSAEYNEDNETTATTTSLPLENDDFTPNYASSTSPAQNVAVTEEEVDSSPITTADPESSEKDKSAGDNAGSPNSDEMSTVAVSTTTPTPEVADNDKDEVKVEHQASSSSEDVQGRSLPDIEALEQMQPDLAPLSSPSQEIEAQPSASPLDVNETTPMISSPTSTSSVEKTESEAPASSSSPASEEPEEAPVPSSSPASEEKEEAPVPPSPPASEEPKEEVSVPSSSPSASEEVPVAASEDNKTEPDVNNDLETTTLINVVDSSSDDASPEKTSPEAEITENVESEDTTDENEDNLLNSSISENEDTDEVTTEDDEDDGPTDATFDESTGSPADGESTEETVPTVPESSVATSTSSTPAPSSKYNFLVYDESNVACILASMSITLRVTYTTKDKKSRTKSIQVPSTAFVSGFCGEKESNMTLFWPISETSVEQKDTITFTMKKDDSKFYVSSVQVSLVPNNENFPNIIDESLRGNSATDLRLFSAPLKSGAHVCRPMTEVTCGQIVVLIKDVSLIAYNDRDSLAGREEEHCSLPPKSISVAAVVGGIVGLTVTIGIVASYAWYRKRTSTFRSELP